MAVALPHLYLLLLTSLFMFFFSFVSVDEMKFSTFFHQMRVFSQNVFVRLPTSLLKHFEQTLTAYKYVRNVNTVPYFNNLTLGMFTDIYVYILFYIYEQNMCVCVQRFRLKIFCVFEILSCH